MSTHRFWGWYVVAASVIGLACGVATTIVATFGVYLGPLRAEFGWTQSSAFAALLAVTLASALLAPLVGSVVDRIGARKVVLVSFVLEILIFASFAWQTAAIWSFYARYVALAVFGLGTTHVAFARVLTLWFDRRRGLALGIALSGVGIGGFLWPLLVQTLISAFGWRTAYLLMAGTIGAIALPLVALLLRDSPAQIGQTPDNEPLPCGTSLTGPTGLSFREAIGTRIYWRMLVTFFLVGLAVQSVMVHLIPLLTGRGLPPMLAALAQSLLFVAVTTGRLTTGFFMDRFFAPRVALGFLLASIGGIALLSQGAAGGTALVAALLVGLAVGAEVDVLAYLTSRYFGIRSFSSIYGSYFGIYSLSGGIGPLLTAMSVDATDSYQLALGVHAGVLVLACVLLLNFSRFPDWSSQPRQDAVAADSRS